MTARLITGVLIGWIIYIVIWMQDYHGGLESVTQPIIGIIISSVFCFIAYLSGLPVKRLKVFNNSVPLKYIFLVLIIFNVSILLFPNVLGLSYKVVDRLTGEIHPIMNPIILTISYFIIIFSIVNWPKKNTN